MYAVTVTFKIKQDYREAFLVAVLDNAEASKSHEEGCRQFDVCTDPQRPNEVFLYELYDDEAAFGIHGLTDHFAEFSGIAADMVEAKKVVTYGSVA